MHCPDRAGWQKLANRIKAPVYCPGWLPDPLVGKLGGEWNNINSVSPDRSYLESFVWQETGGGAAGGELHVNLRAYPGRTKIPTCRTGGVDSRNVPCIDQPIKSISSYGISTLLYLPYAVFCYASPALSVLYGFTGFRIEKVDPTDPMQHDQTEETA